MAKVITTQNFEEEVLKSEKPFLLDFWATWCGPCMRQGPIVEELGEEGYAVGKLDVDQNMELAQQFRVMSIPTLIVFKNGQEVYMSRYEYGVLSLMARHPGQLFTKEQIFEAVWHQDSESCLTAVTNAIGRIRQKIEDDRAAPVYIRTISNLGYQFMPTVSAESVEKDS